MECFFTDRHGGLSHGDFASLNLAMHVGDEIDQVLANRKLLNDRIGPVAFMSQVHGDTIVEVRKARLKTVPAGFPAGSDY